MYFGVISDTHGQISLVRQAVRKFQQWDVARILHCGDIGSVSVIPFFHGIPTDFVFGNCDINRDELRDAICDEGQTCHELFGHVEMDGKKIAFMHGDDSIRFEREFSSGEWDMLCYGHTHESALWMGCEKTIVMNPGALYRVSTPSVAVVELPTLNVKHVNIL
ncbi:MAG: YfcE family phosphodiesterase [Planctomycetaceae bacterium]|jgi:putative phosphoesterase|nr:YfcE family phosphodiesterase [Planctomycetaceae bacterium]